MTLLSLCACLVNEALYERRLAELTDTPDDESGCYAVAWYPDADGDGWGVEAYATTTCEAPDGYVAIAGDCDDGDAGASPDDVEVCGGEDEDCDGWIDEADAADAPTWYADGDGDGFGDPQRATAACVAPAGSVATADDCDDDALAVNPDAPEVCGNGRDDDCDGGSNGCGLEGELDLRADAALVLAGEHAYDTFGAAIATLPDVDGDGLPELAVGAPGHATSAGAVYVYHSPLDGTPEAKLVHDVPDASAGSGVLGAGDLSGDGVPDLVVGAPLAADGYGEVHVVNGASVGEGDFATSEAVLLGEQESAFFGMGIARGPDVDRDGARGFQVSAPFTGIAAGAVYLYDTTPVADDTAPVVEVRGATAATYFGKGALDDAGDVDGDGLDDLFVGAPGSPQSGGAPGRAYLFLGPLESGTAADAEVPFSDPADSTTFGAAVHARADLDGDGHVDAIVGAPYADDAARDAGAVYVFRGPHGGAVATTDAATVVYGVAPSDGLGLAVSAGDHDGDGAPDLFSSADLGGESYVAVFRTIPGGAASAADADATLRDPGVSVTPATLRVEDVDGDGFDDLFVGGVSAYGAESGAGAVFLFPGTDNP
ncbi:MAG: FG-GAP-like repeat-containing protein [Myxococcota bacterium]